MYQNIMFISENDIPITKINIDQSHIPKKKFPF